MEDSALIIIQPFQIIKQILISHKDESYFQLLPRHKLSPQEGAPRSTRSVRHFHTRCPSWHNKNTRARLTFAKKHLHPSSRFLEKYSVGRRDQSLAVTYNTASHKKSLLPAVRRGDVMGCVSASRPGRLLVFDGFMNSALIFSLWSSKKKL